MIPSAAGLDHESDDAVQQTWLRLSRTDAAQIDNLGGWLTTVVARGGEPFSVGGFTVRNGRIAEIDILADPERLRRLDVTAFR